MIWFTILGIVSIIISYAIIARKTRYKSVPSRTKFNPSSEKRAMISLDKARTMVDELVAEEKVIVEFIHNGNTDLASLGPITKEFFSRYPILRTKNGGFQVVVQNIQLSEYLIGYISIGNSEDWDIVQSACHDQIFVVEGFEKSEIDIEVKFPTIYHLILDEVGLL